MMSEAGALYRTKIVHRRFKPVAHELRYRATYLLLDIDRLDETARRLWLFGLRDRDLGPSGEGDLPTRLRRMLAERGHGAGLARIEMLCLPRSLGYVFNPLTTYYGYDADGTLRLMVYEVSNTFGERTHYVLPVPETGRLTTHQDCRKTMAVSPFNDEAGRYDFTFAAPHDKLALTVTLSREEGRILSAYLSGERRPLSDREILKAFLRDPLQNYRVIGGIHWEAFKLWRKGLQLPPPERPERSPGLVSATGEDGR